MTTSNAETPTVSSWGEIARLCQNATGPDRDLDASIFAAMGWARNPKSPLFVKPPGDDLYQKSIELSASVDAVLELIAEKLPGRGFTSVGLDIAAGVGGAQASIEHSPDPCSGSVQAIGCTPALALLAALALAMEVQHDR